MACRRGKEPSRDSTSQLFIINSIQFLNNKRIELTNVATGVENDTVIYRLLKLEIFVVEPLVRRYTLERDHCRRHTRGQCRRIRIRPIVDRNSYLVEDFLEFAIMSPTLSNYFVLSLTNLIQGQTPNLTVTSLLQLTSHRCLAIRVINSRNNASISNFGVGFRWQSEYPWCIIEVKSKHFPILFTDH
ncbi:hypothetical protein AGLY_008975 [Aphis glycines]|uniref:Uncharacterized protein n=1 Tax=Aphis glycines TaxID=307491 RepID=A0A6G0TK45_APHGL|nr:hypothetical protein AGLY_008975 [Aphis glycines]